jgi:hypothetical protein
MPGKKQYGHEVQVLINGDWVTKGGCDRSSHTYAAICRVARKNPGVEIRVLSYKKVVETINRQKMGI